MIDSPYVLLSMSVEHPEPYRATESLRRTFPAADPPDGWLWCYLRPERRDRFHVAVLMERRTAGCDALLNALAALDCGDATGQEVGLHETVLPPRTPVTLRLRLLARRVVAGSGAG